MQALRIFILLYLLSVINGNIETDSDIRSNILQFPIVCFSHVFDNPALVQRFQLFQYDHGRSVQTTHISQKKMCRLGRFLFYIRCHRGNDQRRTIMVPNIILKNQYRPNSAKLRTYYRVKIGKINIAPPILPILADMSSPLSVFLFVCIASHSFSTPGSREIIRRQPAMLSHRNPTSPPSLWPSRELRKYHYPLCVSSPYPLQPDISEWFKIAHRPALIDPPFERTCHGAPSCSWEKSPRTGTYLMNVYSVFKEQLVLPHQRR